MLYFRFTEHSTFVRLLPIICICFTECRLESDDTSLAYKQSDYGNLSLRSRLIQATTLNSEPPNLGENCRHAVENKIMDTTDSNYIYSRARTRIAQSRVASSCFRSGTYRTGKCNRTSSRFSLADQLSEPELYTTSSRIQSKTSKHLKC
jgi:hypothetical protein